jgi:preprotein translocase subunit SecF
MHTQQTMDWDRNRLLVYQRNNNMNDIIEFIDSSLQIHLTRTVNLILTFILDIYFINNWDV